MQNNELVGLQGLGWHELIWVLHVMPVQSTYSKHKRNHLHDHCKYHEHMEREYNHRCQYCIYHQYSQVDIYNSVCCCHQCIVDNLVYCMEEENRSLSLFHNLIQSNPDSNYKCRNSQHQYKHHWHRDHCHTH